MSEKQPYQIKCPKCGHTQQVDLHESLNVGRDPELRDLLMANKINEVTCASCGFAFRVDKPIVYIDPDHQILIYLIPASERQYDTGEDQFNEFIRNMLSMLPADFRAPEVQLVFSRTELIERIFLIEAGLNPRIIEYIKHRIYGQNGKRIPPETKAILFNAEDSNEDNLCFVVQDIPSRKFEAVLQYARETYTALDEMFNDTEKTADLIELFPGPYFSARRLFLQDPQATEGLEDDED
ncbi:MAG TPA: CpXC domain-containing protein [Kiritimatiellia bacterium]|nr:CpXC domain-containing protein [Kiritimatiellia bacterium]HMP00335.1 CpXC domain-containing protein [Kiritimatiellia bacterium]HMP97346.1 CpXC domain-containing protein [Kiritimatiellia bacterium]